MKIPKVLKICGHEYKIEIDNNLMKHHDNYGISNSVSQVIKIDTSFSHSQTVDTLIHEIIHIIDNNMKIKLDEDNVCRLANLLSTTIIDNKLDFLDKESD